MSKGIYFHQANQMAEKTVADVAATLKAGGVTEARVKCFQYITWTGHYDTGAAWDIYGLTDTEARANMARYNRPSRVGAVVSVEGLRDAFLSHGIVLYPWCVPMGLDVEAEAQFGARVANMCGRLDLDVEPYVEFWPGISRGDYGRVKPYFHRLRELVGPDIELTMDFPARAGHEWDAMRPAVIAAAPYVDRLALQSYFGSTQAMNAEATVSATIPGAHPIDHIAHTDYTYNGRTVTLLDMLDFCEDDARFLVWRFPDMDAAQYAALSRYEYGAPPPPTTTYTVGDGILAAMRAHGDVPASDEVYPPSGAKPWEPSMAKAASGNVYSYLPWTGRVYLSEPEGC